VYFAGQAPAFMPPLCFRGTPFQQAVWRALLKIPYRFMAIWHMK
jgi:methylated-DNA-[protein]-cysteine S-methyltransferase